MGVKSIDSFISIFGRHYLYHLLSTWYKKYRHLLLCLLVILPFIAFSQNIPCGTDDYYLLRSSEPSSIKELKLNSRSATILPIVVHIVWFDEKDNLSDEVIAKQIERLNIDFNHTTKGRADIPSEFAAAIGDPQIRFCLAARDPSGNPHSGITRTRTTIDHIGSVKDVLNRFQIHYARSGGHDAWPTDKYINIWVGRMENIFGRSTIGGMVPVMEEDGIVIDPIYFTISPGAKILGRTLVHEMGHYLGLKHTWGQIIGDCDEDDGLQDTPPQQGPYFDCPQHPQFSCGQKSMFMNFMDFVDDECSKFFTRDQVYLMWTTLQTSRNSLLNQPISCTLLPKPVSLELLNIKISNSRGNLHIQSELPENPIYYSVFNTQGQSLLESELYIIPAVDVEIKHWPAGIYFLYFRYNKEQKTVKFLKL